MTEDMHEERLQAVEAFGDEFVSFRSLFPVVFIYSCVCLDLFHDRGGTANTKEYSDN